MGVILLVPLVTTALGAAAGAIGAEISAGILNARFVHGLKEILEPGRAALLLVIKDAVDLEQLVDEMRSLSPQVLRTSWDDEDERRRAATDRGAGQG